MGHILIDIASSLLRAAISTVLAKELYIVTVPSLIAFSIVTYEVLTRDPIRSSMPPYLGDRATWEVIRGRRRPQGDTRDIVRLSIFGNDVFWVSREDVINQLAESGRVVRAFYGNGAVMVYGDKEKAAIEKVISLIAMG